MDDARSDANLRHFSARNARVNTHRVVNRPQQALAVFDGYTFKDQVACDHWMHVGVSPSYDSASDMRYKRNLHECMRGDS
jgi:hypothetical protein